MTKTAFKRVSFAILSTLIIASASASQAAVNVQHKIAAKTPVTASATNKSNSPFQKKAEAKCNKDAKGKNDANCRTEKGRV